LPEEVIIGDMLENDREEKKRKEDRRPNQLASIKDFITFTNESKARRSYQRQLRRTKDTSITGFGYISDSEEFYDVDWSEFDHNGAEAFEERSQDRRPGNLRNGTTKMSYGNLVGRIRRVDRVYSDTESNIDPALSEAEAVWMFSDSDKEEDVECKGEGSGEGEILQQANGEESLDEVDDNSDSNDEEGLGPENGLLIPGFRRVIRRSTRLEVRGMKKGMGSVLPKRGLGQSEKVGQSETTKMKKRR
jgi:hypothetical protein